MPMTLGIVGVISQNFTRGCGSRPGDNVDTNFGRGVPSKIWEDKNVKNFKIGELWSTNIGIKVDPFK